MSDLLTFEEIILLLLCFAEVWSDLLSDRTICATMTAFGTKTHESLSAAFVLIMPTH
jgi:hypothetical protein